MLRFVILILVVWTLLTIAMASCVSVHVATVNLLPFPFLCFLPYSSISDIFGPEPARK